MYRTAIKRSERRIMSLMMIVITLMMVTAFSITASAEDAKWKELEKDYSGKTVVLQTNDVHGAFDGYQYAKGLKEELEKRHAHVILVDSGDFVQGSIYTAEDEGVSATSLMKDCGYDYITIGNHEFDYGTQKLLENLAELEKGGTAVLCSNLVKIDDPQTCAFTPNSVYEVNNSLKIGFYGLLTQTTQTKSMPGSIVNMEFQDKDAMYQSLNAEIDDMEDNGADVIIGLTHLGVEKDGSADLSTDVYANTKGHIGVNNSGLSEAEICEKYLIMDGHSHTVMTAGADGEPIMSTGTKFMNIGVAVIDEETEKLEDHFLYRLREKDTADAKFREGLPSDDNVATKAKEIIDRVDEKYKEVVATSETDLNGEKAMIILDDGTIIRGNRDGETNSGDMIADGLLWYVTEKDKSMNLDPDATVALFNGGSVRTWMRKGDITRKNVREVMPFDNTVCVIKASGEKLLEVLEASMYAAPDKCGGFPQIGNMEITLDESAEYIANDEPYPGTTYYGPKRINRIKSVKINGKELDPTKTYNVLTFNFVANGGDTYYAFTDSVVVDTGMIDASAVEMYLKDADGLNGNITEEKYGKPQGRIKILHNAADDVRPAVKDAINRAKEILASGDYRKRSAEAVGEAIANAQKCVDDPLASASDLTEADGKINDAVNALVPYDESYNSAYRMLAANIIAARREVKASDYKAKSYSRLSEALAEAKKLLDDDDAAAADLIKANRRILSAWTSLESKDPQPMTVKASKQKVKRSAVRRKARTVKAIEVSDARGAVSYEKLSGSKKLTVDKESGKIKVKKGTRRGAYRIRVKVSASGDGDYMAGSKTVTVRVRVK